MLRIYVYVYVYGDLLQKSIERERGRRLEVYFSLSLHLFLSLFLFLSQEECVILCGFATYSASCCYFPVPFAMMYYVYSTYFVLLFAFFTHYRNMLRRFYIDQCLMNRQQKTPIEYVSMCIYQTISDAFSFVCLKACTR